MFLRTERLFLRPAWPEDAAELTRAIGQEPVVRMLARAPWPYREEHARAWIDAPRDPRLPNLLITLPDEGGRIVGGCRAARRTTGGIEVGYWIAPGALGPRLCHRGAARRCSSLARLARPPADRQPPRGGQPGLGPRAAQGGLPPDRPRAPVPQPRPRDRQRRRRPNTRSTSPTWADEATLDPHRWPMRRDYGGVTAVSREGTARPRRAPAAPAAAWSASRQHQLLLHFGQHLLAAPDTRCVKNVRAPCTRSAITSATTPSSRKAGRR